MDVKSLGLLLNSAFDVGRSAFGVFFAGHWSLVTHHFQVLPIPSRRNTLARTIWAGLVSTRRDSLLAQLANVPVLLVGYVPEFDRIVGIKFGLSASDLERIRMKQPVANDQSALRRLRPELVHHDVFRMQTEQ